MIGYIFKLKSCLFLNLFLILILASCNTGVGPISHQEFVEKSNKKTLARINTPATRKEFKSYLNDDKNKAIFLKTGEKRYEAKIQKEDLNKKYKMVYEGSLHGLYYTMWITLTVSIKKDGQFIMFFFMNSWEEHFAKHIYRAEALGEISENLVVGTSGVYGHRFPERYATALVPKNFISLVESETPIKLIGNITVTFTKEDMQYFKKFFEYIAENEKIIFTEDLSEFDLENIPVY